ncbi:pitrilysin family protein [uncultured Intestinimonas sp.]|uniref:EF-P 5-aminopentanol modification-associated protein YfmH n=1 Tax=uncultured Intestinimonas sp. TaxID=1689265 RepID=UPI0025DF7446|nr:pitrilysin family protein [uncultured Intestinimonas sp.]
MTGKGYRQVGETLYHSQLENGLHIYVDVKPEFSKSYAFFATNYGGMDMRYYYGGDWQDTPAGVAHFLEHKMFDTKDGNALQELAANGASPNAFTSIDITGYYFESTEKFEENLRTLLSFVSVPWFTQESVDKEQGIIGQEIRMVEDDPGNQVFYGMLEALYAHNPIRVSIAGTVESIAEITADTLYTCHAAFYDPANMVLCVAGNVDPERVEQIAREVLPERGGEDIPRDYGGEEAEEVFRAETVQEMAVSTPIFQLGWKADPSPKGEEHMRRQFLGELCCEAVFGTSSPLYAQLYSRGLVNQNFSYGFEAYPGCAFLTVGGESRDPWALRDAIAEEVERISREGIDQGLWDRLKKAAYGNRVRSLNSFENICVGLAQSHFAGEEFFRFPEVFASIDKADAEACIARWMAPARTALSVVEPKGENA